MKKHTALHYIYSLILALGLTIGSNYWYIKDHGDFIYQGFPFPYLIGSWGMGYTYSFHLVFFISNLVIYLIISSILFSIFNKKYKKFWISGVIIIIVFLAVSIPLSKDVAEVINCQREKKLGFTPELLDSLANIPEEKLYYLYGSQKTWVNKHSSRCGTYFTLANQAQPIIISDKFFLSFIKGTPDHLITKIFNEEGLDIIEKTPLIENVYALKTSTKSKYQNVLEEAIYLQEKYELIEYVHPDFGYTSGKKNLVSNIFDSFKSKPKKPVSDSPSFENKPTETKKYVEGLGVIKNYGSKKSLKEAWELAYHTKDIPDLELYRFAMQGTDNEGKSDIFSITGYSKLNDSYYRITMEGISYDEDKYEPYKFNKTLIDTNQLRDSSQMIKQAIDKYGNCKGSIELFRSFAYEDKAEAICADNGVIWSTLVDIYN